MSITQVKAEPTQQTPQDGNLLRVCFVCTGNTCRSPMAAAVANAMAQPSQAFPESVRAQLSPTLKAYSAGLYAGEGDPISPHAVKALECADIAPVAGLDYHTHTAHTITEQETEHYDWLVALSNSHAMELLMRFPQAARKIVRMPTPISDPYGGDLARYQACLAEIMQGVRTLFFSGDDA